MISPTIGRKVWFFPGAYDPIECGAQPLDATVCYVHDDRLVNLRVTDINGDSFPRPGVHLLQDDDAPPLGLGYATWMPYQVGQAKKESTEVATFPPISAPTEALSPPSDGQATLPLIDNTTSGEFASGSGDAATGGADQNAAAVVE